MRTRIPRRGAIGWPWVTLERLPHRVTLFGFDGPLNFLEIGAAHHLNEARAV